MFILSSLSDLVSLVPGKKKGGGDGYPLSFWQLMAESKQRTETAYAALMLNPFSTEEDLADYEHTAYQSRDTLKFNLWDRDAVRGSHLPAGIFTFLYYNDINVHVHACHIPWHVGDWMARSNYVYGGLFPKKLADKVEKMECR